MKKTVFCAMGLSLCFLLGCVSAEPGNGRQFDKRVSIVTAVDNLITDPVFSKKYSAALSRAKKKKMSRPVLTIMRIEDNTEGGKRDSNTTLMYRRLQVAVRKTDLFDLVDPEKREAMTSVVIKEADMGVNAAKSGIQTYGEYDPSDFVMTEELAQDENGEVFLYLDMTSTSDGKVFWNEVVSP